MNRAIAILKISVLVLGVSVLLILLTGLVLGRWLSLPLDIRISHFGEDKYNVFVDLLTILLTIIAVGIAAFGIGAWQLLSDRIQRRVAAANTNILAEMQARFTLERRLESLKHARTEFALALFISYNKWFEWSITPEPRNEGRKIIPLEMAINLAKGTLDIFRAIEEETNDGGTAKSIFLPEIARQSDSKNGVKLSFLTFLQERQ